MHTHRSVGAASLRRWHLRASFGPPWLRDIPPLLPHILHRPQASHSSPSSTGSISAAHPKGFVEAAAACPSSLQPPTFRGGQP